MTDRWQTVCCGRKPVQYTTHNGPRPFSRRKGLIHVIFYGAVPSTTLLPNWQVPQGRSPEKWEVGNPSAVGFWIHNTGFNVFFFWRLLLRRKRHDNKCCRGLLCRPHPLLLSIWGGLWAPCLVGLCFFLFGLRKVLPFDLLLKLLCLLLFKLPILNSWSGPCFNTPRFQIHSVFQSPGWFHTATTKAFEALQGHFTSHYSQIFAGACSCITRTRGHGVWIWRGCRCVSQQFISWRKWQQWLRHRRALGAVMCDASAWLITSYLFQRPHSQIYSLDFLAEFYLFALRAV